MSNFAELGRLFFEGIEVYPNIAYRRINDVTVHLDIYKPRNLRGKNKTLMATNAPHALKAESNLAFLLTLSLPES